MAAAKGAAPQQGDEPPLLPPALKGVVAKGNQPPNLEDAGAGAVGGETGREQAPRGAAPTGALQEAPAAVPNRVLEARSKDPTCGEISGPSAPAPRSKNHALIEFASLECARSMVEDYRSNFDSMVDLQGNPVTIGYCKHQRWVAPEASKTLLASLFVSDHHITECIFISPRLVYQLFAPYGAIEALVVLPKKAAKNRVQALVQFVNADHARHVKELLQGLPVWFGNRTQLAIDLLYAKVDAISRRLLPSSTLVVPREFVEVHQEMIDKYGSLTEAFGLPANQLSLEQLADAKRYADVARKHAHTQRAMLVPAMRALRVRVDRCPQDHLINEGPTFFDLEAQTTLRGAEGTCNFVPTSGPLRWDAEVLSDCSVYFIPQHFGHVGTGGRRSAVVGQMCYISPAHVSTQELTEGWGFVQDTLYRVDCGISTIPAVRVHMIRAARIICATRTGRGPPVMIGVSFVCVLLDDAFRANYGLLLCCNVQPVLHSPLVGRLLLAEEWKPNEHWSEIEEPFARAVLQWIDFETDWSDEEGWLMKPKHPEHDVFEMLLCSDLVDEETWLVKTGDIAAGRDRVSRGHLGGARRGEDATRRLPGDSRPSSQQAGKPQALAPRSSRSFRSNGGAVTPRGGRPQKSASALPPLRRVDSALGRPPLAGPPSAARSKPAAPQSAPRRERLGHQRAEVSHNKYQAEALQLRGQVRDLQGRLAAAEAALAVAQSSMGKRGGEGYGRGSARPRRPAASGKENA